MHRLPALHLHLNDLAISQHRPKQLLLCCTIWFAAPVKRISHPVEGRQAVKAHFLFEQEAIRLGLVAFAQELPRRNHFRKGVHALEALAVVCHHVADAPEIIQGERVIFAATWN